MREKIQLPVAHLPVSIFESAFIGVVEIGAEGQIVQANHTFCRYLGYKHRDLKGVYIRDLILSDDPNLIGLESFSKGGQQLEMVPLHMKEGGIFLADIEICPIGLQETAPEEVGLYILVRETVADGSPDTVLTSLPSDIRQLHGDELFRTVAALLNSKLDTDYVLVGAIDAERNLVNANVFASSGKEYHDVCYNLDSSLCGKVYKNRKLTRFGKEIRLLFPEDTLISTWNIRAYVGVPLFDANEQILGVLAVMSEKKISRDSRVALMLRIYAGQLAAELERINGVRALKESEERFRTLFDNMPLAIGIRSLDDECVTDANPRMEELFGMSREEIIGRHRGADTVSEDDALRQKLTRQLIKGDISRFSTEKIYKTNYGTEILCRTTRSMCQIKGRKYVIGILEDITKEKEIEDALREKIRELDEKNRKLNAYIDSNLQLENFAYFASHDLKEPLRTIGGFTQLLNRRYRDQLDPSAQEYIDFIVGGVQNMTKLINDLLVYARVSQEQPAKTYINPRNLIREVTQTLRKMIDESGVSVEIGRLPERIFGYHTNLKQLFQNMISNSIKFRQRDAKSFVRIEGSTRDGYWEFTVQDNGIGMDPQFHRQIFQMFRKLHARGDYEGTGIGLALCKKVVDQHEGEIRLESAPGAGTTFYFTLRMPD